MSFSEAESAACRRLVELALEEDLGEIGDITSRTFIPPKLEGRAVFVARASGVVAGLPAAAMVFQTAHTPLVKFETLVEDGARVAPGDRLAIVSGLLEFVLTGERTALNFLQHLSGIATMTSRFVKAVDGTKTQILDTRKTTPGLRALEKYATRMGGAVNHRMGLWDAVLIKDTHLALVGSIGGALRSVRKAYSDDVDINVEVSNVQELEAALSERAPRILLDNFSCGQVRDAMQLIRGRAVVEVSGGVQVSNARAYALAGADFISVGALTHSAKALDFSLKVTRY